MVTFKGITKCGKAFTLKAESLSDLIDILSCISLSFVNELKNVVVKGE